MMVQMTQLLKHIKWIMLMVCAWCAKPVQAADPTLAVGDKAPHFRLVAMDGSVETLSDYIGRQPVYLIFWNTWCGHCIHKVPQVMQTQKELGSKLKIIAINTSWSDSLAEVRAFQQRFQTNYQIVFDDGAKVTDRYGVWGAPTEFIIDVHGIVRHRDDLPKDLSARVASWQFSETEEPAIKLVSTCEGEQASC